MYPQQISTRHRGGGNHLSTHWARSVPNIPKLPRENYQSHHSSRMKYIFQRKPRASSGVRAFVPCCLSKKQKNNATFQPREKQMPGPVNHPGSRQGSRPRRKGEGNLNLDDSFGSFSSGAAISIKVWVVSNQSKYILDGISWFLFWCHGD